MVQRTQVQKHQGTLVVQGQRAHEYRGGGSAVQRVSDAASSARDAYAHLWPPSERPHARIQLPRGAPENLGLFSYYNSFDGVASSVNLVYIRHRAGRTGRTHTDTSNTTRIGRVAAGGVL